MEKNLPKASHQSQLTRSCERTFNKNSNSKTQLKNKKREKKTVEKAGVKGIHWSHTLQ